MKILVGMSGGFDSTYAARKLINLGHTVEGAVLIMHGHTECESARLAAKSLGITRHEIDCRGLFSRITENFVSEYSNCRTPNPCVICNAEVKLFALAEYAKAHGFEKIATGHYARIVSYTDRGVDRVALASARDVRKDQSYMLYRVPTEILSMLLLPLAEEEKAALRSDESLADMHAFDKGDSLDVCFIPDGDYAAYIEARTGGFPEGNFIDGEGNVLGRHKGVIHYTVGQRKGLGISAKSRLYVSKIDKKLNTVTLLDTPPTKNLVELSGCVVTALEPVREERKLCVTARLRYQGKPVGAEATLRPDGTATLILNEPVFPVTPGQSAVLYDGDTVLFGGFID